MDAWFSFHILLQKWKTPLAAECGETKTSLADHTWITPVTQVLAYPEESQVKVPTHLG